MVSERLRSLAGIMIAVRVSDWGMRWPAFRRVPAPVLQGLGVPVAVTAAFITGAAASAVIIADATAPPDAAAVAYTTSAVDDEAPEVPTGSRDPTYVEMKNVDFHLGPDVILHIRALRGTMRSRTARHIVFDDKSSFVIRINTGEVGVTPEDLTRLLNSHVFAYPGAPLRALKVRIEGNELVQTGRLRKGVSLPFEIRSTVDLTPSGEIRIHAVRTRVFGIGVGRLMRAFRIELDDMLDLDKARGARVVDNDILLDVTRALPPPLIRGRLSRVHIEGNQLVQHFAPLDGDGALQHRPVPDAAARNYMFYRGGVLQFGKLVMLDADLQIVDLDPRDAFRFDIDRYERQLVAGYSKTLGDMGLEVFMKDLDDSPPLRAERKSRAGH